MLAGERAEHEIATGNDPEAVDLWESMAATASGIGLIPEQAWENPDLAASPFGTAPECASIGFQNGKAAGSASPLTWSAAQFVRLSANIRAGRVTEQPVDTTRRYIRNTQAGTALTLTAPEDNSVINGDPVTVTGTTAPNATVDVDAVNTDGNGDAVVGTTTAGADGSFSLQVTPPVGTAVLTVVATAPDGATGFAQRTVVNDFVPGTLVFDSADPAGDDNGPGTYAYPTSADFKPGAYDLRDFQDLRQRRRRHLPGPDRRPDADLRQPVRRPTGGRLRHQPGRRRPLECRLVPAAATTRWRPAGTG